MDKFRNPKTGKAVRAIKYKADFKVEYSNGYVEVVDVKGYTKNPVFLIKKKLFMQRYGIAITIVKYNYKNGTFTEVE